VGEDRKYLGMSSHTPKEALVRAMKRQTSGQLAAAKVRFMKV
jgi:hypothetical protein